MGECHAVEGPQVDRLLRMVLLMRVEVQPFDLQIAGETGVSLPTFTVVIFLVWTVRVKERPTRDAGVGVGTTSPIGHHERVSIVGCVAEHDTKAFGFAVNVCTLMRDSPGV